MKAAKVTLALSLTLAVMASAHALAEDKPFNQDSELVQTCGACHGMDGNSPMTIAPNLAGQRPGYLAYELAAYKTHERADEFMGALIDPVSPEDLGKLATYFSAQKPVPTVATDPVNLDLVAKGKTLYYRENTGGVRLACADCHGDNAEGDSNPLVIKDFPRLAGQQHDYLVSTLKEYKDRMKHHSMLGMRNVAMQLTPDEIESISTYLANLPVN